MNDLNNISVINENGEVQILSRSIFEADKINYISIDEDKFTVLADTLRAADVVYQPEVTEDKKMSIDSMRKAISLQTTEDDKEFTSIVSQNFTKVGYTLSILSPEVLKIGPGMFKNSTYLDNIFLPFIQEISTNSFLGNQIETIYAPNCKTLDPLAFKEYMTDENRITTSINLASITNIPERMFYKYYKLKNINFSSVITVGVSAFEECTELSSLHFPNAESVEMDAFNCMSLTVKSIDFPKVKSIGARAFAYCCHEVETLNIPEVVTIEYEAFMGINKVKNLHLPKVETIGYQAFMRDRYPSVLSNVYMPNVKSIERLAFDFIEDLKVVYAPNIITIGEKAFQYCTSLTDINISSVEIIGDYSFSGTDVRRVELNKVTEIGNGAFSECKNLILIIKTPSICTFRFDNYDATYSPTAKIYVQDNLVEDYRYIYGEGYENYINASSQFLPISDLPA